MGSVLVEMFVEAGDTDTSWRGAPLPARPKLICTVVWAGLYVYGITQRWSMEGRGKTKGCLQGCSAPPDLF